MTAPYLYNTGEPPIYYSGPYWDDKEISAAVDSLTSGRWVSAGEAVRKFEAEFSRKFNAGHCLMVNSGSSANLVMIAALKEYYQWPDGAEVIVSPAAFATTISVLHQNRLKPVFADIEWDTLNFSLWNTNFAITTDTVAIFVSPVLGNPPDLDILEEMCIANGLSLILDGCDSLGTKWNGKYLNEYAVATSQSFYPAHHITTGEGGMVCTENKELADIARSIAWWGRACTCVGAANLNPGGTCGHRFDKWLPEYDGIVDHRYVFNYMGYNLKPLDLQGAIGSEQLKKFDEIEQRRKWSKEKITECFLNRIQGLKTVTVYEAADVSWFGTPFICDTPELKHRLVAHLEANAIQTRNYFAGNILLHPGYSFLDDARSYPNANRVLDEVFFVGAAPHYTEKTIFYIDHVLSTFK